MTALGLREAQVFLDGSLWRAERETVAPALMGSYGQRKRRC